MKSEQLRTGDDFLKNPDQLCYLILCVECKRPLWEQKILSRTGNQVLSTQTLPVEDYIPAFDRHREKCPLCNKRFYAMAKSGRQMYLLKDLKSQITRLI